VVESILRSPAPSAEDQARRALAALPGFTWAAARTARLTPLPGLTNHVFKVELEAGTVCLRVPGAGTAEIIDRRKEAANARAAAEAGVAPEVLRFTGDGVMLTRFIEGAEPLRPARLKAEAGAIERAARALTTLHATAPRFVSVFDAFAIADSYVGVLERRAAVLSKPQRAVIRRAQAVREALAARPVPLKPCHCDPTGANLLDTGERVFLVDWEYSGMNDPMWDLGDLSVEAGFDPAQDEEMIWAYFGGVPRPDELGRVVIYKAMCDLLWTLWGLIQHANENPVDDFMAYALNRFHRCRALMADPDFAAHVKAVAAGPGGG
jgi:thiamine kinase-like enzyme